MEGSYLRPFFEGLVRGIDRRTVRGRSTSTTSTTSTSFTNSTSAATVGEQRPKPCMQSILDDLGFLFRRPNFFVFYYVSQHWARSTEGRTARRMVAVAATGVARVILAVDNGGGSAR